MPNVKLIKKSMKEVGIPTDSIAKINIPKSTGNQPMEVLDLIAQMDSLLTNEQILSVMEEQGCHKTGHMDKINKEFADKHADKKIEDRINLLSDENVHPYVPCKINDDGTFSIYWEIGEKGNYLCVCACIKRLRKEQPDITNVSKIFCGCCGGHIRHHYQNILGITLQLKEVVSSPISSNGKERCEFLFIMVE